MQAKAEKTFSLTLRLDAEETGVIQAALRLVRNFGAVEDWDKAQDLLADIETAVND